MPKKSNPPTPRLRRAGKKIKKKPVRKIRRKKAIRKKAKKPVKIAKVQPKKELSVTDLRAKIPDDKYIAALSQKEEFDKEVEEKKAKTVRIPVIEKKRKASKLHLWILVATTFALILVVWLIAWPYTLKIQSNNQEQGSLSDFSSGLTGSFSELSNSLSQMKQKLFTLEEAANQNNNKNINAIITNPQSLTEEEIKKMEDEVFPKLK